MARPPRSLLTCVSAIVALAAAVCAFPAAALSVVDDTGATISLARPAQRIVSLAPHATELLFAAGAGPAVVGVLAYSDWPPEARALPKVGDAFALELERIVAMAPDLVVTWPYTKAAQVALLRAHGIAVFTTDARTVQGIIDDIERLAILAGTGEAARATVTTLRARLARLQAARLDVRRVRVFYQLGEQPIYTIGGPQLLTEALRFCGADNVFGDLPIPAPLVSVEAILAAKPEAIIAGVEAGRPAWLDAWKKWPALPAVQAGNLMTVDAALLHRPGPRFIDGAEQLCVTLDRARAALQPR